MRGYLPGAGGVSLMGGRSRRALRHLSPEISVTMGNRRAAQGMMIIDAGHYGLEHIFMDFMEGILKEKLPDDIEIVKMAVKFPAVVV